MTVHRWLHAGPIFHSCLRVPGVVRRLCKQYWQQSRACRRMHRSGLCVEPDRDTRRPGQTDGTGAAGAAAADERGTPVRAQGDHLSVTAVPGRSAVPAPVRGVRLDLVAGGSGGVGSGDGVGSAGTPAVYQQDALDAGPGSPPGPARWTGCRARCGCRSPGAGTAGPWVLTSACGSRVRVYPCPGPSPEPDSCQTARQPGSVQDRRSRSRVTPQAPWTGSGWRGYSYGGFGGGHPDFRLHADSGHPGLTDSICQPRPAAESETRDRRIAAGRHRWLAHAVLVPGLSLPSDHQGEDEDHRAAKGHECLRPAA